MKKSILMMAFAALGVQAVQAQTVVESKNADNWYVGVLGGIDSKTTHNQVLKNLNEHAGLRVGRYFTPVVGLAVEGDAFFNDKKFGNSKTAVKAVNVDLLGTLNFTNWFCGYAGQPRTFELYAVAGAGWNHILGSNAVGESRNDLVSRLGLDFAFNLGESRAWQLFVEPAINYNLNHSHRNSFNVNSSALQLSAGLIYKFGNSNGTHNFKIAELRDQDEIDHLNAKINELRGSNADKDKQIAQDGRVIEELRKQLEAEKNKQPTVVQQVTKVVNSNVLQPTVIFGQGKSTIDAAQMASVAMVAKYMKNHKDAKLLIKGYASPEGSVELNQKLSEARANAVKQALVSRYGIAASRLETKGMGATGELFEEVDFNRVATFTDTTK